MNIQLILHNNYNKTKQSITKPYAILWPMPSSCPIHYPGCMDGWMVVWMALWSSHKHPWCSVLVLLLWIINPSLFIYPTPLSATSVVVITGTDIPDTANRECCPGGHYWDYCDGAFSLSHLPRTKWPPFHRRHYYMIQTSTNTCLTALLFRQIATFWEKSLTWNI